ncbi:MAG: hypothetical protein AB9891_09020 [Anaerolineaceae bacterium]
MVDELELTEEEIAAEAERAKVRKGELLEREKSWKDMAEVRMVVYVVPVAIIIALFVYFINQ